MTPIVQIIYGGQIGIHHDLSPKHKKRQMGMHWRFGQSNLVDEPMLERALARQHCQGGTLAADGLVLKGFQWDAYRCNRPLDGSNFNIVKRYRTITAQRSYIGLLLSRARCTTFYDGQDKPCATGNPPARASRQSLTPVPFA